MKFFKIIIALWVVCLVGYAQPTHTTHSYKKVKPRIIITADPELDDNNSLIRFLLYSTDFRVEGLI